MEPYWLIETEEYWHEVEQTRIPVPGYTPEPRGIFSRGLDVDWERLELR